MHRRRHGKALYGIHSLRLSLRSTLDSDWKSMRALLVNQRAVSGPS